jgi:hypothetical protein
VNQRIEAVSRRRDDAALDRAATIAHWLDNRLLDPILGLVFPFVGDLAGTAFGLYAVALAWRRRAPKVLIARMLLNLGVDQLAGLVPVVGDIWDFMFRAHVRNLELLRSRSAERVRSRPGDWAVVGGAVVFFLATLAAPFVLIALLAGAIF